MTWVWRPRGLNHPWLGPWGWRVPKPACRWRPCAAGGDQRLSCPRPSDGREPAWAWTLSWRRRNVCGCAPGLALKPRSLGEKKGTPPRPAPPSASLFQEPEDPPPMAAWGPQNWEQRWDSPSKLGLSGLPSTQVPALIFCVIPGTWRGCSFPCSRVPVPHLRPQTPPSIRSHSPSPSPWEGPGRFLGLDAGTPSGTPPL